ncbi:MAG: hypothetical protein E6G70_17020 [Alphaproteobacteria bacterium]|nr:MAG: hypothetical protein E6G70_17020 [Alphaproteobacteria bacterium]
MNRASPCAFEPGCWCEARKRPTGSGGTAFYIVVARRDAGSYGRKGSDHSTVDEYAFGAAVLALAERALRWNADFLGRRGVAWAAGDLEAVYRPHSEFLGGVAIQLG